MAGRGKSSDCTYKFDINNYVEVHVRAGESPISSAWKFDGQCGYINSFDYSIDDPPRPMYYITFCLTSQNELAFFEDELTLVESAFDLDILGLL